MPFQKIPDLDLTYALISFDAAGNERTDDSEGGVFSPTVLARAKQDKPTDIFFFIHGWKGDFEGAVDQYNRWIGAMWRLEADRAARGASFRPMFIGLHWPSQPWGDEKLADPPPPASFDVVSASVAEPAGAPDVNQMFEDAVKTFGDDPAVRAALKVIFDTYAADPNSFIVPDHALTAYQDLAAAIGFSAGGGPEAAPDQEGVALDPQQAVNAHRIAEAASSFGIFDTVKKGILGGLGQLSFWTMKKRGRTNGEGGMHTFVKDLMNAIDSRIHFMGHSFGCVVVSSILGGPGGKGGLPRPVNSAVLVQGAVSLWSWGDKVKNFNTPGYYHPVLTNKAVSGPVVTTRSANDKAVGLAYPAAVALVGQAAFVPALPLFGGLGSYGIQGTSIAQSTPMLDAGGKYNFQPGVIYNLEGSAFIPSHTGIDGPQVAHAIWEAAL